ncbi:MAG: tyrosine-type recombinase/integrase [Sarcina sp.]
MAKAIAIKDKKDLERVQNYLKENNEKAYVLFLIGLATGYRGNDLIKLTIKDLNDAIRLGYFSIIETKIENINAARVKSGKGKKKNEESFTRTVYISEKLKSKLKEYTKNKSEAEYVYWSQKQKGKGRLKDHIRRDSLGKVFKKAIITCGIDISAGTHTPRKTYGYIMYHAHEKDINFVQELFGHSTAKWTRLYIGIDEEEKKQSATAIDAFI